MTENPPNPLANVGKPAFTRGGSAARKLWAIVTTIGFGVFWVCLLYTLAEVIGRRDLTVWPMVLTPVGLITGVIGRVMMVREKG